MKCRECSEFRKLLGFQNRRVLQQSMSMGTMGDSDHVGVRSCLLRAREAERRTTYGRPSPVAIHVCSVPAAIARASQPRPEFSFGWTAGGHSCAGSCTQLVKSLHQRGPDAGTNGPSLDCTVEPCFDAGHAQPCCSPTVTLTHHRQVRASAAEPGAWLRSLSPE